MSIAGRGRCRSRNCDDTNLIDAWIKALGNRHALRRRCPRPSRTASPLAINWPNFTNGAVTRVTPAKKIAAWLHDQLPDAAMREVLTVGVSADDDVDGDDDDDE